MVVGRRGPVRAAGLLVVFLVLLVFLFAPLSRPAHAFCRSTTCSLRCVPRECMRDDASTDSDCAADCPPAKCRATDDQGCVSKGIPIFWTQGCLSFSVESTGSPALGLGYADLLPLAEKAFALWPAAACQGGTPAIAVTSLGALTCHVIEYNHTGPNANAVIFRDQSWPYGPEVIGLTTVSFNPTTGQIRDADMQINTFDYGSEFTPEGIEYTIAHESGHFLGLDHSLVGDALMYPRASAGTTVAPTLTSDDIAGICSIYPPSSGAPMCDPDPRAGDFEPAKGFAPDCGGDVWAACAVGSGAPDDAWPAIALLVGAAAAAARRRRRSA